MAKYTFLRLIIFIAALIVVRWAGADLFLALVIAAVVSALLSYVLLGALRDQVAGQLASRVERRRLRGPSPRQQRRQADDAAEDDAAARIEQARGPAAGRQPEPEQR